MKQRVFKALANVFYVYLNLFSSSGISISCPAGSVRVCGQDSSCAYAAVASMAQEFLAQQCSRNLFEWFSISLEKVGPSFPTSMSSDVSFSTFIIKISNQKWPFRKSNDRYLREEL